MLRKKFILLISITLLGTKDPIDCYLVQKQYRKPNSQRGEWYRIWETLYHLLPQKHWQVAFAHFIMPIWWQNAHHDVYLHELFNFTTINKKITNLIKDIDRNGISTGIGKPEPLKYDVSGYW